MPATEAAKCHNRRDPDVQQPSLLEPFKEQERGEWLVWSLVDCFRELLTLLCEENIKLAEK